MPSEIETKLARLGEFLDKHKLDGVLLTQRNNFAWITAGKDNHVANNSPNGVASIVATGEARVCLTNSIEAPRIKAEELAGTGIEVVDYPWYDAGARERIIGEVIGARKIATDSETFGLSPMALSVMPPDFNELRWSLTEDEIARYRDGARRASDAMERACRALKPGMTEHDAAGMLDHELHSAGCNPQVTLVASDDRIERFRHPIPVAKKISRYVMLVTCAEYRGLISCLTRFVHFGKVPAELRAKIQAVANIDAAVNLATKPGRCFGDIFTELRRAYADNGFADQWQFHHQGGSTGYSNREAVATPGSPVTVRDNQAFAWNPSVPGVKSEDTILCTARGIEILTTTSKDWPTIEGKSTAGNLRRADFLQV